MMDFILNKGAEILIMFFTALTAWFFGRKKKNVDLKMSQNELEVKLTEKYETLLDNFDKRLKNALVDLDRATAELRERDRQIAAMAIEIRGRDKQVQELIEKVEELTEELKKYKQLSGKKS